MTGNVFQVFLTDDDARAVLATARRHLAPGGRLTSLLTQIPAFSDPNFDASSVRERTPSFR